MRTILSLSRAHRLAHLTFFLMRGVTVREPKLSPCVLHADREQREHNLGLFQCYKASLLLILCSVYSPLRVECQIPLL